MTDAYRTALPQEVARQLRQEAKFGCARCGHPYVEYHHIIPYSEEKHFRPEDMVALCGNCHPAVGKLGRQQQYKIKATPFNVEKGIVKGALVYDKSDLVFELGGGTIINCPVILQYKAEPLISARLFDGQTLVSLRLYDHNRNQLMTIRDNEIEFRADDFWDFEYKHNYAVARHGKGNVALTMDFRDTKATINGKMWAGAKEIHFGRNETRGIGTLRGFTFQGSQVAIGID